MGTKNAPAVTDPDVLAAIGCLAGFWWFLRRATAGRDVPVYLRWATWW